MCGFTGFVDTNQIDSEEICRRMIGSLNHRGPDHSATWINKELGVALGHARLSIIDLSPAGNQPMQSNCGRFVTIFNGEIYNHLALRKQLITDGFKGSWRGHSDTETILEAFSRWGIKKSFEKSVGMFGLAVLDLRKRKLYLARDRMGEKPVYYGWQDGVFLFGSELKALKLHPKFKNSIDRNSLSLLMRYNTIPSPYSIYEGIFKLSPGNILALDLESRSFEIESYWSLQDTIRSSLSNPFHGNEQEALLELESVLKNSINEQMISDVPLGAFLSGGVDSSTIVSLMQSQSIDKIKTFSIGFNEEGFDEALNARGVAKYLNTEHTELYVTPSQAREVIPMLPEIFDEPFSDSSQIPTYLVSKLAKEKVDVCLSGDGGDELFGGYNRHFWVRSIWDKVRFLPTFSRYLLFYAITSLSPYKWDKLFKSSTSFLPSRFQTSQPGDKMHKLANVITANSPDEMYKSLVSHWQNPESLVLGAKEIETILTQQFSLIDSLEIEEKMMFLDSITYLSDDILTKVDRSAMAVSLETRIPLLDHRVVELAWRLPLEMKINHGNGKHILRKLLFKYVPRDLVERPKMGFSVPINSWLRGPLNEWAEDLLSTSKLKKEGFFSPDEIKKKWEEHKSGRRDWQHQLWNVLIFQAWLEKNR